MAYEKRLGVFAHLSKAGVHAGADTVRLTPPLGPEEASRMYSAFLCDLLSRLKALKKTHVTVFYDGDDPVRPAELIPKGFEKEPQRGVGVGEQLQAAFSSLLKETNGTAVIIGSDSPDLPIQYVKRAFLKLKHKDVVIGPASGGGYYLIGLKSPVPALFDGIGWRGARALGETVERAGACGLSLSLLPLWYRVDSPSSLSLLSDMMHARRIEKSLRLQATEAALEAIHR
jgi:rSAM/selenodomain-associated transferase 1